MLLQRLAPRAPGIWADPPTPRAGTPPAMGTLDLVGMLGLIPFLLGGGRGGSRPTTAAARSPIRRPPLSLPPAPEGSLGQPEGSRPEPAYIPKPYKKKWSVQKALEELGIEVPKIIREQHTKVRQVGASRAGTNVEDFIRVLTPEFIDRSFREQMRKRHPDVGGTTEDAQRLIDALGVIQRHRAFVLGEFNPALSRQYEEKRSRERLSKKLGKKGLQE